MPYTATSDDPVWAGVDSDMEAGTINLWLYTDSDSVPTSDLPIELFKFHKRYDSLSRDRLHWRLEYDTVNGMRFLARIKDNGANTAEEYSCDAALSSDGIVGWHMWTVTWDIAAGSNEFKFYRDGAAFYAAGSDTIPSLTVPTSDTFASGYINGPYRTGAAGDVRTAHLAIGKTALVTSDILQMYTKMTSLDAVSVTVFQGGSGITALFENPTNQTGYVTTFNVRGKRLKVYQPNTYTVNDDPSALAIGERRLNLDMTYQSNPLVGKDAGDFLISFLPFPFPRIERVTFDGERNAYLMTMAAAVEPGDRISLTDTHSGVSDHFWVNGVEAEVYGATSKRVTLYLARTFDVNFWKLGVAGFSELGQTTYVSY
jgi:hypothetical protein